LKIVLLLVGEIGVNWDGNYDILESMMLHCKNAGFNAVKFQSFNEKLIVDHPLKKRLLQNNLDENNIDKISNLSKQIGIEWFSTPMYPEAVDFLNPYVNRFKIRGGDGIPLLSNQSTDLLDRVFETGKEVLISVPSSPKNSTINNKNIKWLYVVQKYPCLLEELDFSIIDDFNGYSNHCQNIIAPLTASILGSEIIEVHITYNKKMDIIDNNVSFDFEEIKQLSNLIKMSQEIHR
jgi:N,N'-diacetyllegionaminate synthase